MKNIFKGLALVVMVLLAGCGYTTKSLLPNHYKEVFVAPVENKIDYMSQDQRKIYIPGLETRVRTGLIDRFMFDGNLRITEKDAAQLVLETKLISFDRGDLQLTTTEDVKEYRLRIVVSLRLLDKADNDRELWSEPSFAGEATYYLTGPQAKSESAAIDECLKDLAQRVVARTIENW